MRDCALPRRRLVAGARRALPRDPPDALGRALDYPAGNWRWAPSLMHGYATCEPEDEPRPAYMRGISAAELMAKHFEPVRYIVPGYIAEGCTLLAGAPKIGKSWLALNLGVAVASGGP